MLVATSNVKLNKSILLEHEFRLKTQFKKIILVIKIYFRSIQLQSNTFLKTFSQYKYGHMVWTKWNQMSSVEIQKYIYYSEKWHI